VYIFFPVTLDREARCGRGCLLPARSFCLVAPVPMRSSGGHAADVLVVSLFGVCVTLKRDGYGRVMLSLGVRSIRTSCGSHSFSVFLGVLLRCACVGAGLGSASLRRRLGAECSLAV
jgi:hypothetical protein